MGNQVTLTFAGDAQQLANAARRAQAETTGVARAAADANTELRDAAAGAGDFTTRAGQLGAAVDGASTAFGDAAGAMQALVDIQEYAKDKAAQLARALVDVEQAQRDLNQAHADGRQATLDVGQAQIDAEQSALDAKQAIQDYADAVKEHGKGSIEAKQAQIDLKQAQQDSKQAVEDLNQANLDAAQALTDAKSAQLDMNEAQREANPPELQKWADQLNMYAPLLSGLVGIVALVTAAQWAWNAAQLASPTTWIILAVVALIAVIVLIATKTTWLQDLWRAAWGGIKAAAAAVGSWFRDTLYRRWILGAWHGIVDAGKTAWEWMRGLPGKLKNTFARVADFISAPFRAAFNLVSSAWNNTIGRLSWTVPGWVPGVGGNSISAPKLPKFHSGGVVPGAPGTEMLAVLQAGERVTPIGGRAAGGGEQWIRVDLGDLGDALLRPIADAVQRRGGRVSALGVSVVGGTVRA